MTSKCAALKYVTEGNYVRAYEVSSEGSFLVGSLYLNRDTRGMDDILTVGDVRVLPSYQRCGVGTQLYTRAAAIARERGVPLYSDTARTEASQGFWEKQVRKGRAKCARKGSGARKIRMTPGRDIVEERGKWACQQYVLKPEATDLSGLRRPARRKRSSKKRGTR